MSTIDKLAVPDRARRYDTEDPNNHRRGCPMHVHPSQRHLEANPACTCGGRPPLDDSIALFMGHHPDCPFTIDGDEFICTCGAF